MGTSVPGGCVVIFPAATGRDPGASGPLWSSADLVPALVVQPIVVRPGPYLGRVGQLGGRTRLVCLMDRGVPGGLVLVGAAIAEAFWMRLVLYQPSM